MKTSTHSLPHLISFWLVFLLCSVVTFGFFDITVVTVFSEVDIQFLGKETSTTIKISLSEMRSPPVIYLVEQGHDVQKALAADRGSVPPPAIVCCNVISPLEITSDLFSSCLVNKSIKAQREMGGQPPTLSLSRSSHPDHLSCFSFRHLRYPLAILFVIISPLIRVLGWHRVLRPPAPHPT